MQIHLNLHHLRFHYELVSFVIMRYRINHFDKIETEKQSKCPLDKSLITAKSQTMTNII